MAEEKNSAKNEHTLDIRTGLPILHSKYGIRMDEFDYLDMAINELRDIKHFGSTEYIAILDVDAEGWVELPCNLDTIDAVTTARMGVKAFGERTQYDMESKKGTDEYFTSIEIIQNLGFIPTFGLTKFSTGTGYIPYQLNGGRIRIDKKYYGDRIALAFTGVGVDPEGFPKITRKQANSLAATAATTVTMRKAMGGNQIAMNMLQILQPIKERLKQAASIPEDISDNDIDDIMNIQTSFNRKSYKRPAKYSR